MYTCFIKTSSLARFSANRNWEIIVESWLGESKQEKCRARDMKDMRYFALYLGENMHNDPQVSNIN